MPLGRLLTQVNPDQTSSSITYAQGTTNYIDPASHQRTEVRDAFGQLVTVTQYPDANTQFSTLYQYDPIGNLLSITDPENNRDIGNLRFAFEKDCHDCPLHGLVAIWL